MMPATAAVYAKREPPHRRSRRAGNFIGPPGASFLTIV